MNQFLNLSRVLFCRTKRFRFRTSILLLDIFVVVVVVLFFFFLSVLYVKQITSDAVYMIHFYIEKYLKRAISVNMLQRTMKHGRLRSYEEILCPIYIFTCFSDHP